MEGAIGFSRVAKDAVTGDATETSGATQQAETTVCKYCGEDFKFYQSLKHHLHSQSSCCNKPYTCRDCGVGFSTKANCLRHIQKQHAPVVGVGVESRMAINETLLASQQKAAATEQAAALSRTCRLPAGMRKRGLETNPGTEDGPNKAPRLDVGVMSSIVNGSHKMKQEQMEEAGADDQPLDFSLKTMMNSYHTVGATQSYNVFPLLLTTDSDEPMDLSVGSVRSVLVARTSEEEFDSSSPISLVVTPRRTPAQTQSIQPTTGSGMMPSCKQSITPSPLSSPLHQCTHCHALFKHSSKVQRRCLFSLFYFHICCRF